MSEPVLVALLFADRVITEDNGKKGIIGTFTSFRHPHFPVAFPPWFIYAAVTNLTAGRHTFGLTLTLAQTEQAVVSIEGELQSGGPASIDDVIELILPVQNAVFPQAGRYNVALVLDNDLLGSRVLNVVRLGESEN